MKIVIATLKSWNIENSNELIKKYSGEHSIILMTNKEELTEEALSVINPDYVFFPHWSYIIPANIYEKYECVVFHMTDLPFGRGGSPLQNLIVRGIYDTKISAIKVSKGVDTGPIYMKEPINISEGNATDIFRRISDIVFEKMIPAFLSANKIQPNDQSGEVVSFKRRTPLDSMIPNGLSQRQLYDFIRMLDGEGYPRAFIKNGLEKIEFYSAEYINGITSAKMAIVEDKSNE